MPDYHKQYDSIEAEALNRGIPVWLVEYERRVNAALNQPEFLRSVNEVLRGQEASPTSLPAESSAKGRTASRSKASARGRAT